MPKARITVEVAGRRSRFELAAGELATVGRASACAIRIHDKSVSREHCVAVFTGDKVCISDLESTHGVVHDGERVARCELEPGEGCRLGSAVLTFAGVGGGAAVRPPAPPASPPPVAERTPPDEIEWADADDGFDDRQDRDDGADEVADEAPLGGTAAADEADASGGAAAPTPDTPDVQVAGYRVLERLGAGGFGTVYRARQERLGREVALKVLQLDPEDADAAVRVDAFQREARAAAAINDPHLVQVFDVGQDGGVHYLSMELVTGGSLARRVRRDGPMEWREVLPLIGDVARALEAAHRSGLVHRDVKPANILLTADGKAKLTDLGLASGAFEAGTIAFMAPEQILRREIDERTDIYALGCTAFAALVGRPPFTGDRNAIARAHVKQAPESFQRLGLKVPWHLEQLIVDSMMAKDPADRPQSAADLLARLDRLILPESGPRAAPVVRVGGRRDQDPPPGYAAKALAARVLSELIVFSLIAAIVIAALLALKYRWAEFDIYRLIGK